MPKYKMSKDKMSKNKRCIQNNKILLKNDHTEKIE